MKNVWPSRQGNLRDGNKRPSTEEAQVSTEGSVDATLPNGRRSLFQRDASQRCLLGERMLRMLSFAWWRMVE